MYINLGVFVLERLFGDLVELGVSQNSGPIFFPMFRQGWPWPERRSESSGEKGHNGWCCGDWWRPTYTGTVSAQNTAHVVVFSRKDIKSSRYHVKTSYNMAGPCEKKYLTTVTKVEKNGFATSSLFSTITSLQYISSRWERHSLK